MTLPQQRLGEENTPEMMQAVWETVQRAQRGDQSAVADLYQRYQSAVTRFIYFRCGNASLADDLTQDVWVRAITRLGSFTFNGTDFGAWLITIARNLVADHFKSGRNRYEVVTCDVLDATREDQAPEAFPADLVVDRETSQILHRAIASMLPDQRECITLRFLRGYSTAEVSAVMGRNEPTIKSLQYRGLSSLARALKEELNDRISPRVAAPKPPAADRRTKEGRAAKGAADLLDQQATIRSWARDKGMPVASRGALPKQLRRAYAEAMGVQR